MRHRETTSPLVLAKRVEAINYLRGLAKAGGGGPTGDHSRNPQWGWCRRNGLVRTGKRKWWITPLGHHTLCCWNEAGK